MTRWLVVLVAVLLPGIAPAAEPLGRLFYNPAQRTQLDIARTQRSRVSLDTVVTNQDGAEVIRGDALVMVDALG